MNEDSGQSERQNGIQKNYGSNSKRAESEDSLPKNEVQGSRSSADLSPGGRSSAISGTGKSGKSQERFDRTEPEESKSAFHGAPTLPSGVPVVPPENAVEEAVVLGPSVFDELQDDTVFGSEEKNSPGVRWVRHRPSWGLISRWGLVLVVILVAALLGYRFVKDWAQDQMRPARLFGDEVRFVLEEGWTTNDVAMALGVEGVVDNPAMFRQWMRCPSVLRWLIECPVDVEYSFKAGEYILREHLAFQETVDLLNEGPLPDEVILVMVPEGLTLAQTIERLLSEMPAFNREELHAALISERLRWVHYPEDLPYLLAEGLLFPDTYQLAEDSLSDELNLIERMHQKFRAVVENLDIEERSNELGVSPYEALVIASLIEEEALIDVDRARISRVIYNRLDAGWTLGIDATTRYAVGKTAGEPLDTRDLQSESLWNTRVVRGLPPTAISAPGRASLEAALNPAEGPWMYYVRTDEGGIVGAHTFTVTGEEFERARRVCVDKNLGCG